MEPVQDFLPRSTDIYFAYGSNLHVSQMAERCPESTYIGPGILNGYRWQINQRGVANIVNSPGDTVEGLLYRISPKDEQQLDKSEGVSRGYYQKDYVNVELRPWNKYALLEHKTQRLAQLLLEEIKSGEGEGLRHTMQPTDHSQERVPQVVQQMISEQGHRTKDSPSSRKLDGGSPHEIRPERGLETPWAKWPTGSRASGTMI